ncbi:MAG: OmpA family protein [Phycisphaerales bacterium]|nr:MAG: OmpA family protein [Phycisphaerales bacterium]
MRTVRLSAILITCVLALAMTGCNGNQDLRIQNDIQRRHIADLESQLEANKLELQRLRNELAAAQQTGGIEVQSLRDKLAALEENKKQLEGLIKSLQEKLLLGGTAVPVELSTLLEDFANQHDMVTYDASRGVVRFKSDLLFEVGSDNVASASVPAVQALSGILNSEEAKDFDVIVAGHTDDIRIGKPSTRAKHPTNWHLSVHRAISVKDIMEKSGVDPIRLSVRGFGEYRPIEENLPNKKGNPKNRRVEIFIVPKGA